MTEGNGWYITKSSFLNELQQNLGNGNAGTTNRIMESFMYTNSRYKEEM